MKCGSATCTATHTLTGKHVRTLTPAHTSRCIHYFACAFYRVKKETNSEASVDYFYESRAADPNVGT